MAHTVPISKRNIGLLIHLSTMLKYFFPLGNFLAPITLWVLQRNESSFIDHHGKQAINFQLSLLLYSLLLLVLAAPIVVWQVFEMVQVSGGFEFIESHLENVQAWSQMSGFIITVLSFGLLFSGLYLFDLVVVIKAAIAARAGQAYSYPLCINFLKSDVDPPAANTSASSTDTTA